MWQTKREREREREREKERKWDIIFFHHFAARIRQNFCRSSKKCPTVVIASFQQKSSLKTIVPRACRRWQRILHFHSISEIKRVQTLLIFALNTFGFWQEVLSSNGSRFNVKLVLQNGQRLWLCWQSGCYQFQRSVVRNQSSAKFYFMNIISVEKTKIPVNVAIHVLFNFVYFT